MVLRITVRPPRRKRTNKYKYNGRKNKTFTLMIRNTRGLKPLKTHKTWENAKRHLKNLKDKGTKGAYIKINDQ